MGQASRPRPIRLAEKLSAIREALQLSQNEMISRLGLNDELTQARISAYERGVQEPPLLVLLKYARVSNVSVEALIDDELDLPKKLPASPKGEGIKRRPPKVAWPNTVIPVKGGNIGLTYVFRRGRIIHFALTEYLCNAKMECRCLLILTPNYTQTSRYYTWHATPTLVTP